MENIPNYSKYTDEELDDALSSINKERYPGRYDLLLRELSNRNLKFGNKVELNKRSQRNKNHFKIQIKKNCLSFIIKSYSTDILNKLNGKFFDYFSSSHMVGNTLILENTLWEYLVAKFIRFNFKYKIYKLFSRVVITQEENELNVRINYTPIFTDWLIFSFLILLVLPVQFEFRLSAFKFFSLFYLSITTAFTISFLGKIKKSL